MNKTLLQSQNIRLRPLEPEDLNLLYTIENDTTLWDCSPTNVPYSRYALKQYIATATHDIYADRQVRLVIEKIDTGESIGLADLTDFDPLSLRAELGLLIQVPFRRQGLGREALQLLCSYAAQRLLIHQLYAVIAADNINCKSLFDTEGFHQTAVLHEWLHRPDGYADACLYTRILANSGLQ
jgi:diamine N-acetyltransferase